MDSLKQNLDYLGLSYLRDEFESLLADAAKKNMSIADFFKSVIQTEVAYKQQRAAERRIAQAHFPQNKSLENFDWNHPSKINVEHIRFLATLKFLEGEYKNNVAFIGLPGLGKTHLMISIAMAACQRGYSVMFETAANIVNRLHAAQKTGELIKTLKYYTKPDILCMDEIGYLPIDNQGANLLFQVVSSRYETGSIMLTSNKAFKDWGEIFKDATVASAILDRILHHCEVITIEGKSYRMTPKIKIK